MLKSIYEILTSKKYRYIDADIGLLKRVGGCWRIEDPIRTLGVSVKLCGSDRFGPNKYSMLNYKLRRDELERLWADSINGVILATVLENGDAKFTEDEFSLSEIIFGGPNDNDIELTFAFDIHSAPNEYGANIKNGKYISFYSLY